MDTGKLLYNMGAQCSTVWQGRGMGWSRGWREDQEEGDICILTSDSHCCTAVCAC